MAVPSGYLVSLVARRWGVTPQAVEETPARYVQAELAYMEVEAEAAAERERRGRQH